MGRIRPATEAPWHPWLSHLPRPGHTGQGRLGVLVLHGFTGTPFEMASLVPPLAARGATVLVPDLAGHGAHPWALRGVRWHHWLRQALAEYHWLRRHHRTVAVVGLSMGGVLARLLATVVAEPPDRLVVLAAPYRIHDRVGRWLLPGIHRLPWRRNWIWEKGGPSDIADPATKVETVNYRWVPLEALCELDALLRHGRRRWRPLRTPSLWLHSRNDHTAPFADARAHLASAGERAHLVELERSFHVLPRDVEREEVAACVAAFVAGEPWRETLAPGWRLHAPAST